MSIAPFVRAFGSNRFLCEHMFVWGEATILHADADSFFASVEQRDDPRLRGRPVIVGAGVVLAASYEAKAFGIRTAMSGRRAHQLCPQAIVVEPRFSAYSEASRAMYRVFDDMTPVVEGLSIDEAFLDVRGMERIAGTPVAIAERLIRRTAHAKVPVGTPFHLDVFDETRLTGPPRVDEQRGSSTGKEFSTIDISHFRHTTS